MTSRAQSQDTKLKDRWPLVQRLARNLRRRQENVARLAAKEKEEGSPEGLFCCFCLEARKCMLFFPWRHVAPCQACAWQSEVKKCPNCNRESYGYMKVYS